MALQLTSEQFEELVTRLSTQTKSNKNFTRCNLIYNGERDYNKVDAFITGITIYKQIEGISDEDAIAGLPLLLKDTASTWWSGVSSEIKTWPAALTAIRSAFAPKLRAYEVYLRLFEDQQGDCEPIDSFLCRKRALLGMLPAKRHKEEEQLDFIYGLLKMDFKKKVARSEIKNFADMVDKARHLEALEKTGKSQPSTSSAAFPPSTPAPLNRKNIVRCLFCRRKGHTVDVCRIRLTQVAKSKDATTSDGPDTEKPTTSAVSKPAATITCYGCGAPGVFRSNCSACKTKDSPPKAVHFYAYCPTIQSVAKVPTIEIFFDGKLGYAHIDTAARTSIAGKKLYDLMKQAGATTTTYSTQVSLADGSSKWMELLSVVVNITMGNRVLPINFTVFPDADTRTLLGIDFLQTNGIILDLGQRVWYFTDSPDTKYEFLRIQNEVSTTIKKIDFKDTENNGTFMEAPVKNDTGSEESLSDFLTWASSLQMISPIPDTPPGLSPNRNDDPLEEKSDWKLVKLDSPPPPVRPREPRGIEDTRAKDPRITYIPINPSKLYSIDISLQPHDATYLSDSEKEQFNDLLTEFHDIFNEKGDPTPFAVHKIETGNHKPIALKPYRLSPIRQHQLKVKLGEMLENNIIEESESPWAAPVVLVPKGDSDIRVCVDYRKLNAITIPDRYPLPRIDDLLHQAKAMPYMTTIDLQSGYWQIKIDENDQNKSTFVTAFGTYSFKRMPFGLRNAPSTFQRLMDKFCRELKAESVFAYLDDLICRSPNFKQHLEDLREIFTRLRFYKLRANKNKCKFACATIKYLGHIITPEGIKADPDKIKAISELPAPKNLKRLISFLQTASWYRRFIRNFAEIARPLTNLTKKNMTWKWEQPQEAAFITLKKALTTAPVLKQLDSNLRYIIKTDASNYAIGAALVQGEGDEEHPIEYASRLLTPAERNYTVTEKEALAIVWAVTKFRGYIEGTKFLTITDHQPLKWLLNLKSPTGRLARWALQLQPYEFDIKYTPGRTNVLADGLSRPPCENHSESCEICHVEIDLPKRGEKNIRDEQIKDETLNSIIQALEENVNTENYIQSSKRGYLMHKGVLYRFTPDQEDDNAKLVVPRHEVPNVLKQFHDTQTSGHYGIDRTTKRIEKNFFWKGLRKDVTKYVKSCLECQRYKPSNQKPAGLFQSTANNQRFEVLSIDLFGPLPKGPKNEKWIFIIEDTASRWVELFALSEATAQQCAITLLNEVLLRYGLPRKITSDNGTQFISAVMQQLTFCLDIQQILSPVYHPEPNIVERKNRDLKTQIGIMVKDKHSRWPEALPAIRFAMNSAFNRSTGFTAAYLTYGREMRTPFEITHDLSEIVESENFISEITPQLRNLAKDLNLAKENIEIMQDNNRTRSNQKRRPDPGYNIGDLVLVETHPISRQESGFSAKLAPRRDGPYIIKTKIGSSIYEISSVNEPDKPIGKYHTSAITRFEMRGNKNPEPIIPIRRRGRPKKNQPVPVPGTLTGRQRVPEGENAAT